jgi:hypothetical protein
MRLDLGRHMRRVSSVGGSSVRKLARPGHTTTLATEVELARLSGRNLADVEAETRVSAELEGRLLDGADLGAQSRPAVRSRSSRRTWQNG